MMLRALVIIGVASFLCGCGAPFLSPATSSPSAIADAGLAGEWTSGGDTPMQAAISPLESGGYSVALTVHHKGEYKTTLSIEMQLVEEGGVRFADLFLSQHEREKLVQEYGFLVLPVHQILKLSREGDELRVWMFDEGWLAAHAAETGAGATANDRYAIGGGQITVVTAPTERVKGLLAASRAESFGAPIVFRRAH